MTTFAPTTAPPGGSGFAFNDVMFNCKANNYAGILIATADIQGNVLDGGYELDDLELAVTASITAEVPLSGLHDDALLMCTSSITGVAVANDLMKSWVAWSKIGQVSFELDLVNDAGFKAMAWQGYVYKTIKLGKNAIVYGSGGVTIAFPVKEPAPTFGFKNVLTIGVKNKEACTGNEFVHFFVDKLGCLYKLNEEGLERLGYEEFLLPLVNPVLIWDTSLRRLHISSASVGYIYNDKALGGGFAGLTGLYRVNNVLTAVAPADITADPVSIVTDIIDFNQRGMKCIENINWGVFADETLQAAIDYRFKKDTAFVTSDWTTLNDEGVSHQKVGGIDFRFRLKSTVHGTFDLKYANIQFKPMDIRFTRSLIGSTGQPVRGRNYDN